MRWLKIGESDLRPPRRPCQSLSLIELRILSGEMKERNDLSRLELVKRLKKVEDELNGFTKENRMLKRLVENQEIELKRYRSEPFLAKDFEGTRRYDQDLIDLLKKGRSQSSEEILARLGIDRTNVELVKALSNQLEVLEAYGLVAYSGRGWRWTG